MGRPLSHEREVTGTGRRVLGRGSFTGGSGGNRNSSGRGGGGSPFSILIVIIIAIISVVTGKGNILSSLLGGFSGSSNTSVNTQSQQVNVLNLISTFGVEWKIIEVSWIKQ